MKRTFVKIVLLITAISLSVYGVLYWKDTVVSPPNQLEFENNHEKDLAESVNRVSIDSMEVAYEECRYKLRRYLKEGLIDTIQATYHLECFMESYVPKFIAKCGNAFDASEWDKASWSHSFMKERVAQLKSLERPDGTAVIDELSDYYGMLDNVLDIIKRYDAAWKHSKNVYSYSISYTKELIAKAYEYKNDEKLKNCVKLVEALNAMPHSIRNNHVAHLQGRANNTSCGGLDTYSEFDEELRDILSDINGFESYYGGSYTKDIRKKLLDKEYSYLQMCSTEALDYSNSYTWDEYCQNNLRVYNYMKNSVGKSTSKIKTLVEGHKRSYESKTETEFNEYYNNNPRISFTIQ